MTDNIRNTEKWKKLYSLLLPKYTTADGIEVPKGFREPNQVIPENKLEKYLEKNTLQTEEEFKEHVDTVYSLKVNPTNPMSSFDNVFRTLKDNNKKKKSKRK